MSFQTFGEGERQQDAAIARILYFFEKHWEELLKFSRRPPAPPGASGRQVRYTDQPTESLDYVKKCYHGGRYICVNLQNSDTVEFRMFRGTLKTNTLLAALELVDRICDVAFSGCSP